MKKQSISILFFACLLANIAGVETGNLLLQYATKPLLMPMLFLYFLMHSRAVTGGLKKWVLLALFFSWAGDVLLMFQEKIPDFFLFGLSAFLLAHVFYIFFFHGIRTKEGVSGKPWLLLPVALYYGGLMIWLSPYLGDMSLPVRIYGLVISFMLMLSLHLFYIRNKEAARLMIAGALLFVLSDSVLAVNKFFQSFTLAGTAIMITYGFAQYYIVQGAVNYINSRKNN